MYGLHVYDKSKASYVQSLTILANQLQKSDLMLPVEAIAVIM